MQGQCLWADPLIWEIKSNSGLLSSLMELTHGHNAKPAKFRSQLDVWLHNHGKTWSWTDVDDAVLGLRAMVSTLGAFAREPKAPSARFDCLGAILSKLAVGAFPRISAADRQFESDCSSDEVVTAHMIKPPVLQIAINAIRQR